MRTPNSNVESGDVPNCQRPSGVENAVIRCDSDGRESGKLRSRGASDTAGGESEAAEKAKDALGVPKRREMRRHWDVKSRWWRAGSLGVKINSGQYEGLQVPARPFRGSDLIPTSASLERALFSRTAHRAVPVHCSARPDIQHS